MSDPEQLKSRLSDACAGLVYISETDAQFAAADLGDIGDMSPDSMASALGVSRSDVQVGSVPDFFAPLIAVYDDSTPERQQSAKKFLELKTLLEENLVDLAVYTSGDVRKKIYILGRHESGRVLGVSTEAVETG